MLDVTEQTVNNWKIAHPDFFEALKNGKKVADNQVIDSLFKRANGYEYDETTQERGYAYIDGEKQYDDNMGVTKIVTKHYPADVTACIYWLINRIPEDWKKNGKDPIYGEVPHTTTDFEFDVIEPAGE